MLKSLSYETCSDLIKIWHTRTCRQWRCRDSMLLFVCSRIIIYWWLVVPLVHQLNSSIQTQSRFMILWRTNGWHFHHWINPEVIRQYARLHTVMSLSSMGCIETRRETSRVALSILIWASATSILLRRPSGSLSWLTVQISCIQIPGQVLKLAS